MKANGWTIKLTATVFISTLMELSSEGNGWKINKRVTELKPGQMELSTKEIIKLDKKMVLGFM